MGSHTLGDPASIWEWASIRALGGGGYSRGACFQCQFEPGLAYAKPTGALTDCPAFFQRPGWHQGWPRFKQGFLLNGRWSSRLYYGPLPKACGHGHQDSLARTSRAEEFKTKTKSTAVYPPGLCKELVTPFIDDFVSRFKAANIPSGGGDAEAPRTHDIVGVGAEAPLQQFAVAKDTPRRAVLTPAKEVSARRLASPTRTTISASTLPESSQTAFPRQV